MVSLSLTAVMGILALCIDFGQKYLVDAELQRAADASAIAGAMELSPDGSLAASSCGGSSMPTAAYVVAQAAQVAGQNASSGGNAIVSAGDIELGWWDDAARTFSPEASADDANAVRTTLTRSKARGNPIQTSLAPVVGINDLASSRTATARCEAVPDYALIGLDHFNARGLLVVTGTAGPGSGNLASNGDVSLNLLGLVGITSIDGRVATNGAVNAPLIGTFTRIRNGIYRPKHPFKLPAVSLTRFQSVNDNVRLGGALSSAGDLAIAGVADLYAGTYCVRNVTVLAGALVRVHGPVVIYVQNDVLVLGTVLMLSNDPADLKVRVRGPGTITLAANLSIAADVYAPKSQVTVAAGVNYSGRLIGQTVDVLGTSSFTLDATLAQPEVGRERTTLVR